MLRLLCRTAKCPELLKRRQDREKEAALTARVVTRPQPSEPVPLVCPGPSMPLSSPCLSHTIAIDFFISMDLFSQLFFPLTLVGLCVSCSMRLPEGPLGILGVLGGFGWALWGFSGLLLKVGGVVREVWVVFEGS